MEEVDKVIHNAKSDKTKQAMQRYVNLFENFRGDNTYSEELVLSWFMSTTYRPTSLQTIASHIKEYITTEKKIQFSWDKVYAFINAKKKNIVKEGKPLKKKAPAFTKDQIYTYLEQDEKDDLALLRSKLIAMFSYFAGLRVMEANALTLEDINEDTEGMWISVWRKKNDETGEKELKLAPKSKDPRSCAITLWKKYINAAKGNARKKMESKIWLQDRNGKLIAQVIGEHPISQVSKDVAKFLGISNWEEYTFHSFRSTSATVLADNGATIENIKRHGDWKSQSACEGYIRKSKKNKIDNAKMLSKEEVSEETDEEQEEQVEMTNITSSTPSMHFVNSTVYVISAPHTSITNNSTMTNNK